MAAGAASKKGLIGYIVPFGIPEVVRHINAFTLGAQATHPGAKVKLIWTNAWYSPPKETAGGREPHPSGVDVLGQNVDSAVSRRLRREARDPVGGLRLERAELAPKQWLTAAVYNWGPYYLRRVKAAMNGTWKPGFYYGTIKDGFTKHRAVRAEGDRRRRRPLIAAKRKAIMSGKFYDFQGPLYDQKGKLMVRKGKTPEGRCPTSTRCSGSSRA